MYLEFASMDLSNGSAKPWQVPLPVSGIVGGPTPLPTRPYNANSSIWLCQMGFNPLPAELSMKRYLNRSNQKACDSP